MEEGYECCAVMREGCSNVQTVTGEDARSDKSNMLAASRSHLEVSNAR